MVKFCFKAYIFAILESIPTRINNSSNEKKSEKQRGAQRFIYHPLTIIVKKKKRQKTSHINMTYFQTIKNHSKAIHEKIQYIRIGYKQ